MQGLKGKLKPDVHWEIGAMNQITATNQPWFEEWDNIDPIHRGHTKFKVAELYDFERRACRIQEFQVALGEHAANTIVIRVQQATQATQICHRLIWDGSQKGVYTVNGGYKPMISVPVIATDAQPVWGELWKWSGLISRSRLSYGERCMKLSPTSYIMHTRIRAISPVC